MQSVIVINFLAQADPYSEDFLRLLSIQAYLWEQYSLNQPERR